MPADIRTLDLNLLKTLDALLDERSVTRTAARLALTQPAVSGMLTRLRESFDDPLFVRGQRGMLPTARALELAAPVKQVLADIGQLLHPGAFDPASTRMTVRVAATEYALQAIVAPTVNALRARAPGMRIAVLFLDDARIATQFERGDLDLALSSPERTPPGLHEHQLFDEDYVCVMRGEHPAARARRLTLDRFCALEHALMSYSGGAFEGATDAALARIGRTRRVALSVPSFVLLPEVLRGSDLVAMLPRRLAATLHGLKTFEPPLEIHGFSKTLVWHERTRQDAALRWVRAVVCEACGAPAAPD